MVQLQPDIKSTEKKLVEGEEIGTPSEDFKSDLNVCQESSDRSEEEMILAIREDKSFGSDGDLTSEECTTDEKEKEEKMPDALLARIAHLKEET